MTGAHSLDRLIGNEYPTFASGADVRAFEQVPYADRIAAQSTYDAIKLGAAKHPDAPAIQFLPNADPADTPIVITHRDFVARVTQAANMFHALGGGGSEVVSFLLPLLPEAFITLFGAEAAGIANPVNPLLEPDQIAEILEAANTTILVALGPVPGTDIWKKVEQVRGRLRHLKAIVQVHGMSAAGSFSFYPSKNLGAAGDAGLIICDDDELAERFRIYRQHGMEPRYFHHVIGGNFRLDAIQAAILMIKLPHLDDWSAARRRVADSYRAEFTKRDLTGRLALPAEPYRERNLTNHHIYHQYVIRTPQRDALQKHLDARGIGNAIYYPLGLHEQKCFAALGYRAGDLPETERAARETLALPIYPELTPEMQRAVVDAVEEFFNT